MLHRKLDWQHYEGVAWLLEHGADPNRMSHWGRRALAHALGRTSPLRYFRVLFDHAADPTLPSADGILPAALAARTGRADVLDLFAQRGFPVVLTGDDVFLAACARGERRPRAGPEIVAVLLDAGARVDTVHPFPSGSPAADALLREHGRAG